MPERIHRRASSLQLATAYAWALTVVLVARFWFHGEPPPRYADLFLPGVALICVYHSWRRATILFGVSLAMIFSVVAPLSIEKMRGFGLLMLTGIMIIWVIELAKRREE